MNLPKLREYQLAGIAAGRAAARELQAARPGEGYGILFQAPTGSGKTLTALHLCQKPIAKGRPVLWLAGRDELIQQPLDKLAEHGMTDVRVLKAGRDEGPADAPITVASIHTLARRGLTPPADVVVFDEARHFLAKTWNTIAAAYSKSVRMGLDATPARADGRPLGDLFDAIIPISSVSELTALGFLVPSVVVAPDVAVKDLSARPVDAYLEHAPGTRCIVFAADIPHAELILAEFLAAGVAAELVHAKTPKEVRRGALDRVRAGETKVLVNVLLFTEGLDLVELETIVIARGVSHESTFVQIGGRGLRPSPGKTLCRVLDLRGHVHRFGLLDDDRQWHLTGKACTREALPPLVMCKACHGWFRGGGEPCPSCGAVLPPPKPPKVSKREMKEIARERLPRVGPEWDYWLDTVETMLSRGYKPGWASMRFQSRYGHWPKWGIELATKALKERERAA